MKVFISCSLLGHVNIFSKAWGGCGSDIEVVRDSGFISLRYHNPGDQISADRGFTLVDHFAAACGAQHLVPPFTKGKKQLSADEVELAHKISSVHIHIGGATGLMKNRYSILKGMLPVRCVQSLKDEASQTQFSSCDKQVTVCAALVNVGRV